MKFILFLIQDLLAIYISYTNLHILNNLNMSNEVNVHSSTKLENFMQLMIA